MAAKGALPNLINKKGGMPDVTANKGGAAKGAKGSSWQGKNTNQGDMMTLFQQFLEFTGKGYGGKGYGGKGTDGMAWQKGSTSGGRKRKCDESGGVVGDFVGTIKSFVRKTGYGFIECPELGDVFMLEEEMRGYQVGHTVRFTAVRSAEGKPQAKDLRSGLKEDTFVPREPKEDTFVPREPRQKRQRVEELGEHLGDFQGRIKSFVEKTGYGFIECAAVSQMGYQDVFLHAEDKWGHNVDDIVAFSVYIKPDGKPHAKYLIGQDEQVLGQFVGEIKSFVVKTHWGFISCPELAANGYQDVFLHGDHKGDFQVGQKVSFYAVLRADGKPQARFLQPAF